MNKTKEFKEFLKEYAFEDSSAYLVAYREAIKAHDEWQSQFQRPDNGWISVEDRLPENRQEVLAFRLGRMYQKSWEEATDQDEEWFKGAFTHWQPLPSPPIK